MNRRKKLKPLPVTDVISTCTLTRETNGVLSMVVVRLFIEVNGAGFVAELKTGGLLYT